MQVTGCRFVGPRRSTQETYQRRDKNIDRDSPGHVFEQGCLSVLPHVVHAKGCPLASTLKKSHLPPIHWYLMLFLLFDC